MEADSHADVSSLLASYTDDVIWLPPFSNAVEGKSQIKARYELLFREATVLVVASVEETILRNNMAFIRGTTKGTRTPKSGGPPANINDKFIALLRCEEHGWRVSHLMWSPVATKDH